VDKLSAEQRHMERIYSARTAVLPAAEELAGATTRRLTDSLFQAAERATVADFRYRKAERESALGLDMEAAQWTRRTADRHNAACLELLTNVVPSAIDEVRHEFGDMRIDAKQALTAFAEEARYQVAETDFTHEEAVMAERLLSETIAAGEEGGIGGLCDQLDRRVADFVELRRERPEHNNPVAFVVGGIIAGIGATILAICWAVSQPGGCTNSDVTFVSGVLISFGLFIIVAGL
jgi:hypothetical protein